MESKSVFRFEMRKFRDSEFNKRLVPEAGKPLLPREMQSEFMEYHRDDIHAIVQGPTGNGKSKLMATFSLYQSNRHGMRKNMFIVPQTIIGKSYCNFTMDYRGEAGYGHEVGLLEFDIDLRDRLTSPDTTVTKKGKGVLDFLKSDRLNLVCTYSSFISAYKTLSDEEIKELFDCTRIWVDECHHISTVVNGGRKEYNRIGGVIDELMRLVPSCRIGMATATYCRGDLQSILSPESYERFTRYLYPYDRFFASMEYLESFEYKFVNYHRRKGWYEPANLVGDIFNERHAKTIIYVPSVNSRCSHGKQYEVQKILESLGRDVDGGREYPEEEDGIIRVVRKDGKVLKAMNLVSENGRDAKKLYIESLRRADDLDVVIALGMFKEGADWEFAERSIVIGYRGSIQEMLQIAGRLFRDIPGKTHIEIIHMMEACLATDSDEFEGDVNKMMIATIGSMLMENVYDPIRLPLEKAAGRGKDGSDKDYLSDAVPEDLQRDFFADVYAEVANRLNMGIDGEDVERFRNEEFDDIVKGILEGGGFDSTNAAEIAEKVWRIVVRRAPSLKGLNLDNIDIKLVHRINPIGCLCGCLATGKMDEDTFKAIRQAFRHRRDILDEEFRSMHAKVLKFETTHNRKPSDFSPDADERELGEWVSKWQRRYNSL